MIAFSFALNQSDVDALFARALPSLFPADIHEPIKLCVYTVRDFAASATERSNATPTAWFTGGIEILVVDYAGHMDRADLAAYMQREAIARCLADDDAFILVNAQSVYAVGTLSNAYAMHRITGRIVAIFDGGVDLDEPVATVAAFLANRDKLWRDHSTDVLGVMPGSVEGRIMYSDDMRTFIFTPTPEPFMGSVKPGDELRQRWSRDRVIALTDLRSGFAVHTSRVSRDADFSAPIGDFETLQSFKFEGVVYCFTYIHEKELS